MFDWWFQKLGGSEPTPDGLALTFEFVRSKKGSFYDENTKNNLVDLWGSKNQRKHHLRIQEGHFLKIALNLDLALPDDGECPALLISCGIIDLQNDFNILVKNLDRVRISVPMSYISFW